MAVAVRQADGNLASPQQIIQTWRERIEQAKEHRKKLEPIWLSNLAFAAGQHWLAWDPNQKKLRHISELDPKYRDRDLYTADKINEHVQAQLGELQTDDDRPELLLAQDGDTAEDLQKSLNEAVAYAWEHEWAADSALTQARRLCLKLGTSAIRVRFDPTKGPVTQHMVVGPDGQPVQDDQSLGHLEQTGQLPDGSLPKFQPVHEGRTTLEPLSAFHLLTPPGINHEDVFPWEVVVRPTRIEDLQELYPNVADALTEDGDIASIIGLSTAQQLGPQNKSRLRGHVWLYTCYERPCRSYPNGRTVVLASNQYTLLDVTEELPYVSPDGTPKSGIEYFHWWRLDDRFWSRSLIEPMKDPQRLINRRETQNAEIIDRGMPKVFTVEGTLVHNPQGLPLENIELKQDAKEPNFFAGIGPGPWMYQDLEHHADNMAHASTLSALRLGENPMNVNTYSQLALLNENEAVKRSTILHEHKAAISRVVQHGVHDIRKFWPEQKQILVTGEDDRIAQQVFLKARIPDFFVVKTAKGSAAPRSQGAELKKIDTIWAAIETSGLAATNPAKYIDWFVKSLNANEALELPEVESDAQTDMAKFENFLMLDEGIDVEPADYDLLPAHIPEHREAQNQARASGDLEAYRRIETHVQKSIALVQANAAKVAAAQAVPSPFAAPPSPGPPAPALAPPMAA